MFFNKCRLCDMSSLQHYHTEDQAARFVFGCQGEKFDACKRYNSLMRQGHPGARGWDSRVSPTKEELDQMRAQDEIDNKRYWDEIESLKKIITGDGNV